MSHSGRKTRIRKISSPTANETQVSSTNSHSNFFLLLCFGIVSFVLFIFSFDIFLFHLSSDQNGIKFKLSSVFTCTPVYVNTTFGKETVCKFRFHDFTFDMKASVGHCIFAQIRYNIHPLFKQHYNLYNKASSPAQNIFEHTSFLIQRESTHVSRSCCCL